ncbi:MAG TPA: sulfur carrier protein ThiS [Burkholderiales bacterium]|nr:sulfur carrier protein ThiS [Burkholderiales bacterium]
MHITINGKRQEIAEQKSVASLLLCLDLNGKRLAIELNGEILPRSQFASTLLADGDRLEIIVAVGGG